MKMFLLSMLTNHNEDFTFFSKFFQSEKRLYVNEILKSININEFFKFMKLHKKRLGW